MKKAFKILKWVLIAFVSFIAVFVAVLLLFFPRVGPAPDLKITADSTMIKRGEYLANHVSGCMFCHSKFEKDYFGLKYVPGFEGHGGHTWTAEMGLPGNFIAPNITPGALKDWTDGEIFRAITSGLSKDGTVLFPLMPYPEFRQMATEDVKSIIAYLRTLKPSDNKPERSTTQFPVSLFIRMAPQEPEDNVPMPSRADKVAYGKYMTTIAACAACHTQQGKMGPDESKYLAGGSEYAEPGYGIARSANLTPDPETGIGNWTEEAFVAKFKMYLDPANVRKVNKGEPFSAMPWSFYASMDEEDLKAIFAYLKSVKPVVNKVEKWTAEK